MKLQNAFVELQKATNLLRKLNFCENETKISGTLHEDLSMSCILDSNMCSSAL